MNNKKPDQNKYWIKYINFRRKMISNYNTFIEALFKESDYFSFDTPVAIIRPFNTYGPRQSARAVIPTIITQIAGGQRKIKLGALTPTRDFNYIKDTVRGFVAIAESDKSIGETINIGSNYEISIEDTVNLIAQTMGVELEVLQERKRMRPEKSEVERLWAADNTKAYKLLNWKPEYAGKEGFKRGLAETVQWFTDEKNLRRNASLNAHKRIQRR
ncbi:GDP-mannose 4,6-dehydratase [Peptococcaceae bacterium]|nr:GDP-mannose 4,6-dehydratase [Peptococcaceae bacterium]